VPLVDVDWRRLWVAPFGCCKCLAPLGKLSRVSLASFVPALKAGMFDEIAIISPSAGIVAATIAKQMIAANLAGAKLNLFVMLTPFYVLRHPSLRSSCSSRVEYARCSEVPPAGQAVNRLERILCPTA